MFWGQLNGYRDIWLFTGDNWGVTGIHEYVLRVQGYMINSLE